MLEQVKSISKSKDRKATVSKADKADKGEKEKGDKKDTSDVPVFVIPPPKTLFCPLHFGLLNQPLLVQCGHTFCEVCLNQLLKDSKTPEIDCPIDKKKIRGDISFPNLALATQVQDLEVYCKYGLRYSKKEKKWEPISDGCPEKLKLSKKEEHEKKCPFAVISCPHCSSSFVKLKAAEHEAICAQLPCPNKNVGCVVVGTKEAMNEHKKICKYEHFKEFMAANEQQMQIFYREMEEKTKKECQKIRSELVVEMKSEMATLQKHLEETNARHENSIKNLMLSMDQTQKQLAAILNELREFERKQKSETDHQHGGEKEVVVEDSALLKHKHTFIGHNGPVWCLTISIASGVLISGSSDSTIKTWDITTGKLKQTYTGHEGIVHCIAVHGKTLISGSSDKTIKVWNLETMTVLRTLRGMNHWVRAITVSNGRLYTGSYNIIKVWDLTAFQCIKSISTNCGSVYSLALCGGYLMAGTYENTISVLDVNTFDPIVQLLGHAGAVYSLAVSGSRLFSGSYDNSIKVWDVEKFQCVQTVTKHTSSVDALSSFGGFIYSGSADNSIKAWKFVEPLV